MNKKIGEKEMLKAERAIVKARFMRKKAVKAEKKAVKAEAAADIAEEKAYELMPEIVDGRAMNARARVSRRKTRERAQANYEAAVFKYYG